MKTSRLQWVGLTWLLMGFTSFAAASADEASAWQALLEKEWLLEAQLHAETQRATQLGTADDAAGGCDGVTNGKWGFHTAAEPNPWWQVDLGQNQPLAQVRLWNRADNDDVAARAANFRVLLSSDG